MHKPRPSNYRVSRVLHAGKGNEVDRVRDNGSRLSRQQDARGDAIIEQILPCERREGVTASDRSISCPV